MKTPEQKAQTKAKRALKRNFFMEALRRELALEERKLRRKKKL